MRGGFSLVEVLVALLVLEVGMLATSALALQALRTHRAAVDLERAGWAARRVVDSLATVNAPGPGERLVGGVLIRWRSAGPEAVSLEALVAGRPLLLRLRVPIDSETP